MLYLLAPGGLGAKPPTLKLGLSGNFGDPTFGIDSGRARRAFSTRAIEELLVACHARLQHVILECLDWRECLERYDREWTVFYLDPPYYGRENYYGEGWKREDFEELAERLRGLKGKFILSINDTPETRRIFRAFECLEVKTQYSISYNTSSRRHRVTELLFKNF